MVHAHQPDDSFLTPAYAGRFEHSPVPKNRMPDSMSPPEAVYRMRRETFEMVQGA